MSGIETIERIALDAKLLRLEQKHLEMQGRPIPRADRVFKAHADPADFPWKEVFRPGIPDCPTIGEEVWIVSPERDTFAYAFTHVFWALAEDPDLYICVAGFWHDEPGRVNTSYDFVRELFKDLT